jgi:Flp pilus assembly protein TadD
MVLQTQGLLRLSDGDARGAVASLQEAVEGAPGSVPAPQLQLDLAKALAAAGESAKARRVLEELREQELGAADRTELDALAARLR